MASSGGIGKNGGVAGFENSKVGGSGAPTRSTSNQDAALGKFDAAVSALQGANSVLAMVNELIAEHQASQPKQSDFEKKNEDGEMVPDKEAFQAAMGQWNNKLNQLNGKLQRAQIDVKNKEGEVRRAQGGIQDGIQKDDANYQSKVRQYEAAREQSAQLEKSSQEAVESLDNQGQDASQVNEDDGGVERRAVQLKVNVPGLDGPQTIHALQIAHPNQQQERDSRGMLGGGGAPAGGGLPMEPDV